MGFCCFVFRAFLLARHSLHSLFTNMISFHGHSNCVRHCLITVLKRQTHPGSERLNLCPRPHSKCMMHLGFTPGLPDRRVSLFCASTAALSILLPRCWRSLAIYEHVSSHSPLDLVSCLARQDYYPHFAVDETETQRGQVIIPSHPSRKWQPQD